MFIKPLIIVFATTFLGSAAFATPASWNELNNRFFQRISYNSLLAPDYSIRVESFFRDYFTNKEQVVFTEHRSGFLDTSLDFLAIDCVGIISKLVPAGHPNREATIQLAVDHIFYQATQRLDQLNYDELCLLIRDSLAGKQSFIRTLVDRNIIDARNRMFYFLIEKASRDFEDISHLRSKETLPLNDLLRQLFQDEKVWASLNRERELSVQPVVESWEDIATYGMDNFVELALKRSEQAAFLTSLLRIAGNL